MSLLLQYKDKLLADRMIVLDWPYSRGNAVRGDKLYMAKDKTFAFGSVGPTLTPRDQAILAEIIKESLNGKDADQVQLTHTEWFKGRGDLSVVVMTKRRTYHLYDTSGAIAGRLMYPQWLPDTEKNYLLAFDSNYPSGAGTGFVAANIAAQEGVPMEEITKIVADVEYTVSDEYDLIDRAELVDFPQ